MTKIENDVAVAKAPSCCHTNIAEGKKRIDYLWWGSFPAVTVLFILGYWFDDSIAQYNIVSTMAETVVEMVFELWWGIVIGMIFIGILSKVPATFVMSMLGKGGTMSGLLRATGAGVLLDLCSHGILMVAVKLYQRGASAGQVIAFLLASPWNSFSLTLILIALIGFGWTVAFIVLSMAIGLITGYIFDKLVARGVLVGNPHTVDMPENFDFWAETKAGLKRTQFTPALFKDMALTGIRDSKIVVRWLMFGILLAGLIRVIMNPEQFQSFFGPTALGLLITIVTATVIEVCSEGSTPIAADIMTRANAPGNSFAFLMAGVSTDYTEIMILKDTTKSWRLPLFIPLITVPQIVAVSLIINYFT